MDGGWSKRSHKHSYNANSGVGIIWDMQQENFSTSVCATSIARLVPKAFLVINIGASSTGQLRLQKWRLTSFWRGFGG